MYVESFASKLKKAREKTGFTQAEVCEEMDFKRETLSRYENGKLEPNLETLGMLCDFYSVSADWLIGTQFMKQ